MANRLPELIVGPGALVLRRWRREDAEFLGKRFMESIEHLRLWMPWARTNRCRSRNVVR